MFIFALIATILYGALPVFRGYIAGKGTTALVSKYQTVRYDDGLKYSIIYLIIGILHVISYFFLLLFYALLFVDYFHY